MLATGGIGAEPGIVGQIWPFDDLASQPLPFTVVGGAEHHGLTVTGGVGRIWRDGGRAHSERLLIDTGVLREIHLVAHDVGHHVEQAEFDLR